MNDIEVVRAAVLEDAGSQRANENDALDDLPEAVPILDADSSERADQP